MMSLKHRDTWRKLLCWTQAVRMQRAKHEANAFTHLKSKFTLLSWGARVRVQGGARPDGEHYPVIPCPPGAGKPAEMGHMKFIHSLKLSL